MTFEPKTRRIIVGGVVVAMVSIAGMACFDVVDGSEALLAISSLGNGLYAALKGGVE